MVNNLLFLIEILEIDFDGRLDPLEEKVIVERVVLVYFQMAVFFQDRFHQLDVVTFSQGYPFVGERGELVLDTRFWFLNGFTFLRFHLKSSFKFFYKKKEFYLKIFFNYI
jgi:hypothetical protein